MQSRLLTALLFHIGCCTLYFAPITRSLLREEFFIGRWPALTYWNLWAQALYYGFSALIDIMKPSFFPWYSCLIKTRDKIYASIIFPVATFVFTLFWTLFIINRDMIFPVEAEERTPPWTNHISHTVVFPVALFEMWIVKHRYPRRTDGLIVTQMFGIGYLAWILYLYAWFGYWPYGVIQILPPGLRILLFIGCLGVLATYYIMGESLNRIFHSQSDSQTEFARNAFGKNEGEMLLKVKIGASDDIVKENPGPSSDEKLLGTKEKNTDDLNAC